MTLKYDVLTTPLSLASADEPTVAHADTAGELSSTSSDAAPAGAAPAMASAMAAPAQTAVVATPAKSGSTMTASAQARGNNALAPELMREISRESVSGDKESLDVIISGDGAIMPAISSPDHVPNAMLASADHVPNAVLAAADNARQVASSIAASGDKDILVPAAAHGVHRTDATPEPLWFSGASEPLSFTVVSAHTLPSHSPENMPANQPANLSANLPADYPANHLAHQHSNLLAAYPANLTSNQPDLKLLAPLAAMAPTAAVISAISEEMRQDNRAESSLVRTDTDAKRVLMVTARANAAAPAPRQAPAKAGELSAIASTNAVPSAPPIMPRREAQTSPIGMERAAPQVEASVRPISIGRDKEVRALAAWLPRSSRSRLQRFEPVNIAKVAPSTPKVAPPGGITSCAERAAKSIPLSVQARWQEQSHHHYVPMAEAIQQRQEQLAYEHAKQGHREHSYEHGSIPFIAGGASLSRGGEVSQYPGRGEIKNQSQGIHPSQVINRSQGIKQSPLVAGKLGMAVKSSQPMSAVVPLQPRSDLEASQPSSAVASPQPSSALGSNQPSSTVAASHPAVVVDNSPYQVVLGAAHHSTVLDAAHTTAVFAASQEKAVFLVPQTWGGSGAPLPLLRQEARLSSGGNLPEEPVGPVVPLSAAPAVPTEPVVPAIPAELAAPLSAAPAVPYAASTHTASSHRVVMPLKGEALGPPVTLNYPTEAPALNSMSSQDRTAPSSVLIKKNPESSSSVSKGVISKASPPLVPNIANIASLASANTSSFSDSVSGSYYDSQSHKDIAEANVAYDFTKSWQVGDSGYSCKSCALASDARAGEAHAIAADTGTNSGADTGADTTTEPAADTGTDMAADTGTDTAALSPRRKAIEGRTHCLSFNLSYSAPADRGPRTLGNMPVSNMAPGTLEGRAEIQDKPIREPHYQSTRVATIPLLKGIVPEARVVKMARSLNDYDANAEFLFPEPVESLAQDCLVPQTEFGRNESSANEFSRNKSASRERKLSQLGRTLSDVSEPISATGKPMSDAGKPLAASAYRDLAGEVTVSGMRMITPTREPVIEKAIAPAREEAIAPALKKAIEPARELASPLALAIPQATLEEAARHPRATVNTSSTVHNASSVSSSSAESNARAVTAASTVSGSSQVSNSCPVSESLPLGVTALVQHQCSAASFSQNGRESLGVVSAGVASAGVASAGAIQSQELSLGHHDPISAPPPNLFSDLEELAPTPGPGHSACALAQQAIPDRPRLIRRKPVGWALLPEDNTRPSLLFVPELSGQERLLQEQATMTTELTHIATIIPDGSSFKVIGVKSATGDGCRSLVSGAITAYAGAAAPDLGNADSGLTGVAIRPEKGGAGAGAGAAAGASALATATGAKGIAITLEHIRDDDERYPYPRNLAQGVLAQASAAGEDAAIAPILVNAGHIAHETSSSKAMGGGRTLQKANVESQDYGVMAQWQDHGDRAQGQDYRSRAQGQDYGAGTVTTSSLASAPRSLQSAGVLTPSSPSREVKGVASGGRNTSDSRDTTGGKESTGGRNIIDGRESTGGRDTADAGDTTGGAARIPGPLARANHESTSTATASPDPDKVEPDESPQAPPNSRLPAHSLPQVFMGIDLTKLTPPPPPLTKQQQQQLRQIAPLLEPLERPPVFSLALLWAWS